MKFFIIQLDQQVFDLILQIRRPLLDKIMILITNTGNFRFFLSAFLITIFILSIKQYRENFYFLIISTATGELLIQAMKFLVMRERPPEDVAIISEFGFSYPSSHSYIAVAFYGFLIYFIFKSIELKILKFSFLVSGLIFVLLLGFSRIYLGVHWLTDVLTSFTIGGIILAVSIYYLEKKVKKLKPGEFFNRHRLVINLFSGFLVLLWLIYLVFYSFFVIQV